LNFLQRILLQLSTSSFTMVMRTMIKIIQSNPEKIQKSVILFMPFFGYLFLRHLLPYLLTLAKKGMPGRGMSWSCWERLCGACLSLITGIPDHCPDHTTVYKVPFTFSYLPCSPLLILREHAVSELCKRVACETRVRAALMPLTHWHASEAKRNG